MDWLVFVGGCVVGILSVVAFAQGLKLPRPKGAILAGAALFVALALSVVIGLYDASHGMYGYYDKVGMFSYLVGWMLATSSGVLLILNRRLKS